MMPSSALGWTATTTPYRRLRHAGAGDRDGAATEDHGMTSSSLLPSTYSLLLRPAPKALPAISLSLGMVMSSLPDSAPTSPPISYVPPPPIILDTGAVLGSSFRRPSPSSSQGPCRPQFWRLMRLQREHQSLNSSIVDRMDSIAGEMERFLHVVWEDPARRLRLLGRDNRSRPSPFT